MRSWQKGLLVTALHLLIVMSVAGQFYYDRTALPRVWVKTVPFDPDLPIRGRYVNLQLVVEAPLRSRTEGYRDARLEVREGKLHAVEDISGRHRTWSDSDRGFTVLLDRVAYFIPEHAQDPSRRLQGEELWVECSIPKNGPPRPIRLGVKKGSGRIEPLPLD